MNSPITTTRKLKKNKDRYGAFESATFDKAQELGFESVDTKSPIRSVDAGAVTITATPKTDIKPKKQELSRVVSNNRKLKLTDVRGKAPQKSKAVAGMTSKERITLRNACLVAVYCLVVVSLIVVIALNATALTNITKANAALQTSVTELSAEHSVLSSELSVLTDPARLMTLAKEMNLTASATDATVVAMEIPQLLPKTEVVFQTNWFDQLCNFVGNIIA